MNSPDRDITPLLDSKLPQLRLVCFPVYEVVDISIRVISHVCFFRGGAAMGTKEKIGALLPTGATIFIRGALKFFMVWIVSEAFATPLGLRRLPV